MKQLKLESVWKSGTTDTWELRSLPSLLKLRRQGTIKQIRLVLRDKPQITWEELPVISQGWRK